MPIYLYKCSNCGRGITVFHPMDDSSIVQCRECFGVMFKAPQLVSVNWGGNKPSDGGVTPLIKQMIADAPRRRDEMQARKESDGND